MTTETNANEFTEIVERIGKQVEHASEQDESTYLRGEMIALLYNQAQRLREQLGSLDLPKLIQDNNKIETR